MASGDVAFQDEYSVVVQYDIRYAFIIPQHGAPVPKYETIFHPEFVRYAFKLGHPLIP